MGKKSLLLLAITLTILGTAVAAGHPAWGAFTGFAILLLAGGIAAGALKPSYGSEEYYVERRAAGQKISNRLATLSSAAILAVYVAGYHRTSSAAEEFAAQTARRKTAAPITAGLVAPNTAPGIVTPPAVRTPAVPRKKVNSRNSSPAIPGAAPLPVPTEQSQATPSASAPPAPTASNDPVAGTAASPAAAGQGRYKDGTYLGMGYSRHGDIEASVVIHGGKIVSTAITQCLTRYSCSVIHELPGQVVTRQSAAVDYISGATESSDAFIDGITEALAKAGE